MDMYDVIVIGAGIAGSTTAGLLADKGWSVLVIDKNEHPGQHVACGGLFSKKYFDIFSADISFMEQQITGVEFVFPWGAMQVKDDLVTVRRCVFDNHLAQQAVAKGAQIATSTRATRWEKTGSGKIIVDAHDSVQGVDKRYQGRVCVFADGPFSLAAANPRFSSKKYRKFWSFALAHEITNCAIKSDTCKIYLDDSLIPWGYGWIFPNRDAMNAGVGTLLTEARGDVSLKRTMDFFVNEYAPTAGYLGSSALIRRSGGVIPMHPLKYLCDDSVAVIGDAAGTVSPLLGAGIDNAFVSAGILVEVLDKALSVGDVKRDSLIEYERKLSTGIVASLRKELLMAKIIMASMRIHRSLPAKIFSIIISGKRYSRLDKIRILFFPALGTPKIKQV